MWRYMFLAATLVVCAAWGGARLMVHPGSLFAGHFLRGLLALGAGGIVARRALAEPVNTPQVEGGTSRISVVAPGSIEVE